MGSHASIDLGPVMVRGAIRARHARLVWTDGTLYVISRNRGRIERQVVTTTEPVPPKTRDGYWKMQTDEGQSISATRRGCGG